MKTSWRGMWVGAGAALGAAALLLGGCSSDDSASGGGVPASDAGQDAAAPVDASTPVNDGAVPTEDASTALDGAGVNDAGSADGALGAEAAAAADAGAATVVFSNPSGSNALTTSYSAASTTSASATKSQTEVTVYPTGGGVRTLTFYLESAYLTGSSFTLGSPYDNLSEQAHLAYTDKNGQWYAASGTVTVEAASATQFTFHVRDAAMTPSPNDSSVGTFTLTADGPTKVN